MGKQNERGRQALRSPRVTTRPLLLFILGAALTLALVEGIVLLFVLAIQSRTLARYEVALAGLLLGVALAFSAAIAWWFSRAIRGQAAARLVESERSREMMRRLIDNSSIGVALIDAQTRLYLLANPKYERNAGSRMSMTGHGVGEFTPPKISGFINWLLDKVITTGEPFSVREFEADLGVGREHTWWNNDVIPLFGPDGHVESVLAITQEVTDQVLARKKIERLAAEMQAAEERLRLATEAAGVGTWDWDIASFRVTCSNKSRAIFGLGPETEVTREVFLAALHEEDRQRYLQTPRERWVQGEYFDEFRVVWADGSVHWVLSMGHGLHDDDGKPTRAFGVVIDITNRKQVEAKLQKVIHALGSLLRDRTRTIQDQARQLRTLVEELSDAEERERRRLAQVLHDHLQQLLVGAKLAIESALRQVPNEEVRNGLDRAESLVVESIQSSRSLTTELSPPVLHQKPLPQALLWLADWMKDKHGLTVDVEADEQASPTRQRQRMFLFYAVRELLFNVVKHAGTNRAQVRLNREKGLIRVVVADSGAGFDAAKMSDESRIEGGFGLFSIRQRALAMGGSFEIDSAPGQGSRFSIRLPTVK